MKYIVFIFLMFPGLSMSQIEIGKTKGANIVLEDSRYVVTFQSNEGKYVSIYMPQSKNVEEDGLFALKRHVYLLFENKQGDFLLQFEDDSVFLIYRTEEVIMEIWRKHDSVNKISSTSFTLDQFQQLFGEVIKKSKT